MSPWWDQGYVEDLVETFGYARLPDHTHVHALTYMYVLVCVCLVCARLNLTVHYFHNYTDRIEEIMKQPYHF